MGSKHFENAARRAWWSIHIEAWRRSGLSRKRYCQKHRLDVGTFGRWLAVIGDAIVVQHQARSPRKPRTLAVRIEAVDRRSNVLGDARRSDDLERIDGHTLRRRASDLGDQPAALARSSRERRG